MIPAGGAGNNSGINPSPGAAIGGAANGGVSAGNSVSQSQAAQISPEEALEKRFSPAEAEDLKKIANRWNDIVNQSSMPMQQFLRAARVAVADNSTILQLVFSNNSLAKEYFEREHHKNLDLLSELVAEQTGKVVTFKCTSDSHQPAEQSNYIDLSKIHQTVIFE